MKAKKVTARRVSLSKEDRTLCDLGGYGNNVRVSWEAYSSTYNPRKFPQAIKACRLWIQDNPYIQTLINLKRSFYDFGFKIVSADSKGKESLKEWMDDRSNKIAIGNFRRELWNEFLSFDNVAVFWRDDSEIPALCLDLTKCDYEDQFGLELLKYRHELTPDQIKRLPASMQERYAKNPEIIIGWEKDAVGELTPVEDEHFLVLKRVPVGYGFGMPRLLAVRLGISEWTSAEVGEDAMAFASRLAIRQHLLGHDPRDASKRDPKSFRWSKARSDAIINAFKGREGLLDFTSNFDHIIKYVFPDPKCFDSRKWDSMLVRFAQWAGPLGWMISQKGLSPFLMPMLRAEAMDERDKVKPYIEAVLNEAFNPPTEIVVKWSDKCFHEARIAADLLKFYTTAGAASLTTGLKDSGFDPEEERDNKRDELRLEKETPGIQKPIYDPSHGAPEDMAGRPGGTPDPQNAG